MDSSSAASERPPVDRPDAHAEGTSADGSRTTGNALPEFAGLTEMVRTLIEDRERREREIAEERERMDRLREEERRHYAEESERRIQDVRRQMDHLQGLFTACVTATTGPTRGTNTDTIKLMRLGENDDVEAYLTTFERIMEVNEVRS